jgi:HEAT repeat protein
MTSTLRSIQVATFLSLIIAAALPAFAQCKRDEAWDILRANLNEKSAERRAQAIRVLGLLPGDPRALKDAQDGAKDSAPEVRAAAAVTLGELHSRQSVPLLREMLNDDDPAVVIAAASALIVFQDPDAYEVYYEILTGERKTGKGLISKQMTTLKNPRKMAQMGMEEGIGFIPYAGIGLAAFKELRTDDGSPIRVAAAKMLIKDSDLGSGHALVTAISDKNWAVRSAALEALSQRGDSQFLASIEPAMEDSNLAVRCTAAAAVIHLSSVVNRGSSPKFTARAEVPGTQKQVASTADRGKPTTAAGLPGS